MINYGLNALRGLKRRILRKSEGEEILVQRYIRIHGTPPDLNNPRTFTEKLFYRMVDLNDKGNPLFTRLSDKLAVRDYVADKIGEQYLIKLLWSGKEPESIPFDALPAEYVVKTNHASGQVIVVKGKVDKAFIIDKLLAWLKINYYWECREYQYYGIEPRVLIEERIKNKDGGNLLDYKYWCFGGRPELVQVLHRASKVNVFYDLEWNKLDLRNHENVAQPDVPKPANLEQMNHLASRLSEGLDYVRIDLYNVDGKIYFGEFTFTPAEGTMKLKPESWDAKLGEKWALLPKA